MFHPIDREWTAALREMMRTQPVISTKDAIDMLSEHYVLNPEQLKLRDVRRIVRRCAKQVSDEDDGRMIYLLADKQLIVNMKLCNDKKLLNAIMKQMRRQLTGYRKSYKRLEKRIKAVAGQISMDELIPEREQLSV